MLGNEPGSKQAPDANNALRSIAASSLRERGAEPHDAARFLIRLLVCLFAEDVGLLPAGLFTQLVERTQTRPDEFGRRLSVLFGAMAQSGAFGVEDIKHFNGRMNPPATLGSGVRL